MFLQHFKGDIVELNSAFNQNLKTAQANRNEQNLEQVLDEMYTYFIKNGAENQAKKYNEELSKIHTSSGIDDENFTLRYQNAILRLKHPAEVFRRFGGLLFIRKRKSTYKWGKYCGAGRS